MAIVKAVLRIQFTLPCRVEVCGQARILRIARDYQMGDAPNCGVWCHVDYSTQPMELEVRHHLFLAAAAAASLTFSTAALAADSMAYCWLNSKDYYRCFGPSQLIFVGEKDIAKPLELSGCTGARRKTDFTRAGIGGGAWFTCQRKLEKYHNSPEKIRSWVNSQ